MLTARVDGEHEIPASEFAKRSPGQRLQYRGRLTCPDRACDAPAHFRSRGSDGKPALFYSNEHTSNCSEKSPESNRPVSDIEREEDEAIWNDATELAVRLDELPSGRARPEDEDKGDVTKGRRRRHVSEAGERETHVSSIGLRPLLRRLRDDRQFRISTMPIALSDGTQSIVADACTHASQYVSRGRRQIVWGTVVRAHEGWINSGYRAQRMPAVRVPDTVLQEVLTRAHLTTFSDLAPQDGDSYDFIVEGLFRTSTSGAPYVTVESAKHLAFLPSARGSGSTP